MRKNQYKTLGPLLENNRFVQKGHNNSRGARDSVWSKINGKYSFTQKKNKNFNTAFNTANYCFLAKYWSKMKKKNFL